MRNVIRRSRRWQAPHLDACPGCSESPGRPGPGGKLSKEERAAVAKARAEGKYW